MTRENVTGTLRNDAATLLHSLRSRVIAPKKPPMAARLTHPL